MDAAPSAAERQCNAASYGHRPKPVTAMLVVVVRHSALLASPAEGAELYLDR